MADRRVNTVLGPIPAGDLGHTQPHEHLLSDLRGLAAGGRLPTPGGGPWHPREIDYDTIRPRDYQWIRRYDGFHPFNLRLDDVDGAVEELCDFARLGGGTIVDSTSVGIGRDPEGLRQISLRTGLHIVMGSGFYLRECHPPELATMGEAEIAETIAGEFRDGVGATGIRPGLIGEIGLSHPPPPEERRVLRAAAKAQADTGAVLQIHPGRHPDAPFDALEEVVSAGGRAGRTIMCHVDRTYFELADFVELARTGCYLEFDLFGLESGYYPFAPVTLPNDGQRIRHLLGLRDAGYLDRLLISTDIAQKVRLLRYGGEGYGHILENVLPLMARDGFADDEIATITRRNPAEALALS